MAGGIRGRRHNEDRAQRHALMPVPLLDLIVLGIVVISALLATVRGFTREILAIASWCAAAVAALMLHPALLPYVKEHISNPTIALVVAIAAIFLVTLIIVSFITVQLSDLVLDSRIGALDRSLGFLFGAARGFLICAVAFLFFNWLVTPDMQPEWAREAKTRGILQSTGDSLMALLPDDPETAILQRLKRVKPEGETGEPPAEAVPEQRTQQTPGSYEQSDKQGIRALAGGNN